MGGGIRKDGKKVFWQARNNASGAHFSLEEKFSKMLKAAAARSPLKRNVALEEVGNAGLYLASDLSKGTTGEVIYVDCGCHSAYASSEEMDILANNIE